MGLLQNPIDELAHVNVPSRKAPSSSRTLSASKDSVSSICRKDSAMSTRIRRRIRQPSPDAETSERIPSSCSMHDKEELPSHSAPEEPKEAKTSIVTARKKGLSSDT